MQITNVTNYSTQKQKQPNFGMVLDFTPEVIESIGKRRFGRLKKEVKPWITKGVETELEVKGVSLAKDEVLLSTEAGSTKAQDSCVAEYGDLKAYLKKFNDFFSSL